MALNWRGHAIVGKDTYLNPWKRITKFACDVAEKLRKRFPPSPFLAGLAILNPQAWKAARDKHYNKSGICLLLLHRLIQLIDVRLRVVPEFLQHFVVLEEMFQTVVTRPNTLATEFQEFILEK